VHLLVKAIPSSKAVGRCGTVFSFFLLRFVRHDNVHVGVTTGPDARDGVGLGVCVRMCVCALLQINRMGQDYFV
jgi:hypothetical protein